MNAKIKQYLEILRTATQLVGLLLRRMFLCLKPGTTLPCDACGHRYEVMPFPVNYLCGDCEREMEVRQDRRSW